MTHRAIGEAGLALIKKWEGCSLSSYRDSAGVWTIGYGHTGELNGKLITAGMKISAAEAEALLREDCRIFAEAVDNKEYVPVTEKLNGNQRDALISFAFNCGTGSLKRLCKGRSVEAIAEHLTAYVFDIAGHRLAGLLNRRLDELALYRTSWKKNAAAAPGDGRKEEAEVERYQTVESCPTWARSTVEKLLKAGFLQGDGEKLELTEDMLRVFAVNDRAGLYK